MEDITPDMLDQGKPFWYVALVAEATRPDIPTWVDPTRVYLWNESLQACIEDLARPFEEDNIDIIAGIDAVGFILGAAIAARLGKGFLLVRKAGHLCIDVDQTSYVDYTNRVKTLQIRKNAFAKGTRVLLIDQWMETSQTMRASIKLVEGQGGVVAGIGIMCTETTEGAVDIMNTYKTVHSTPEELQEELNQHSDDFFPHVIKIMKK